ncbi:MAG: ABC transporter substrate-binding protein [Thermomicrobiales bacterium]|nr:ABC transporter substrate-binding protein [Thermomicrobiales bacterium]
MKVRVLRGSQDLPEPSWFRLFRSCFPEPGTLFLLTVSRHHHTIIPITSVGIECALFHCRGCVPSRQVLALGSGSGSAQQNGLVTMTTVVERSTIRPAGWTAEEWQALMNALTRRRFVGGALASAALFSLAACGLNDDDATETPTSRTVDTAQGQISVPVSPSRVVSIDYFTAIFLIELGLTPVGGIDYSWVDASTMFPAYVEPLKALTDIGQITSTDIEQVVTLNPDLILGPTPGSRYDNSKGAIERLASVAPVASVDFGQSGDWRDPFRQTANFVNRLEQLTPLKESYEAAIASTKDTHADVLANTVVTVIDYSMDGQFAIDLPKSGVGVVLADLGVHFGAASVDDGTNSRSLSIERLSEIGDSDLILFRSDSDGNPISGLEDVFTMDAWKSLNAVQTGQVYPAAWIDLCTYRWAELAISEFARILDQHTSAEV